MTINNIYNIITSYGRSYCYNNKTKIKKKCIIIILHFYTQYFSKVFTIIFFIVDIHPVKGGKGGYSSIGRASVCGTVGSQFKSGYPPLKYFFFSAI